MYNELEKLINGEIHNSLLFFAGFRIAPISFKI